MKRQIFVAALTLLALLGTFQAKLQAAPVSGTLVASGSANLTGTSVAFLCTANGTGSQPCPTGYGNFAATTDSNGSFAPYGSVADAGFIGGLNFKASNPINQPFLASNYLFFSAGGFIINPDISLDLNFVQIGTFGQISCGVATPPAPGQVCTPVIPALITPADSNGLSELNLTNTSSGSKVSFAVNGTALRISTGEISQVTGTFNATLLTSSLQSVVSTLQSPGGSVPVNYLFTFTAVSPVPEPATFVIGAMGMAGLFLLRRRRSS